MFGNFLKDTNLRNKKLKIEENNENWRKNPLTNNLPVKFFSNPFFKEDYFKKNLMNYLNGDINERDLIIKNNFPNLDGKSKRREGFYKKATVHIEEKGL